MKAFSCSIDMSKIPGSRAKEIQVRRTAYSLFWCRAVVRIGEPAVELGPVVLGFDGAFSDLWSPQTKALVGGEKEMAAFFAALRVFLKQRQVLR